MVLFGTFSLNGMQPGLNELSTQLTALQDQLAQLTDALGMLPKVPPPLPPRPPAPPKKPPGLVPVMPGIVPIPKPAQPTPVKKIPVVKKPIIEVPIPKVEIKMIMALAPYLQQLKSMPAVSAQQKAERKARAKGTLNGLLAFVASPQFKSDYEEKIQDAAKDILAIDPLLISTAAIILRQAQIPMYQNYRMMANYYHTSIQFIANEFDTLARRKGKGRIHLGFREDIDEALSYPIELEGEVQEAKTIIELQPNSEEATQAQIFISRIDELREWLLELLKKPENRRILEQVELPVDFYISIFEKKADRTYCDPSKQDPMYIPFIRDLREIIIDIEEYNQGVTGYSRSLKIYKIQSIINKLKGYLAHAIEKSYCQICLWEDIKEIQSKVQEGAFDLERTFDQIREFLTQIYTKEQNEAIKFTLDNTLPKLIATVKAKQCMSEDDLGAMYL